MIYGYSPKPAVEVGNCNACDDMMYDYEVVTCNLCDWRIHQRCEAFCDICKRRGCKGQFGCLKEIDGLLYCFSCQEIYHECKNAA